MKKKGFTLIELLAVIVIISIITLIAVPIILSVIEKSRLGSLKDSAYGLLDEANLYYMQYHPESNLRFDINNGVMTSNDTDKLLSYKGYVKNGSIILTNYGKVAICINDGKFAAYKNLLDKDIIVNNEKNCNIPEGNSIIYLEGTSTITELSNQELTTIVQELQSELAEVKKGINPIGTIIAVSHNTVPDGYLACNGQTISRVEYAELFNVIGTTYGEGDGSTTFKIPDLRGEFLRGTGTNSHTNQGNGANIGKHQDGTIIPFIQTYVDNSQKAILTANVPNTNPASVNAPSKMDSKYLLNQERYFLETGYVSITHLTNISYEAPYTYTSRPTNTSVLYAIRVK